MRVAIYYAPETDDPLWQSGCAWLGRDAETGLPVAQADLPHLAANTSAPARYGFHATLKAPMELLTTAAEFESDVIKLARGFQPMSLPTLAVRQIDRFAALTLTNTQPDISRLAEACVTQLDHHRSPESAEKRAKRAIGLAPQEIDYLERWGYPFVLEHWQFHMSLCNNGCIDSDLLAAAANHFGECLSTPRRITSLAVFIEDKPGAAFRLSKRIKLGQD